MSEEESAAPISLRCEGVKMSFGGIPVLRGIDLRIRPGSVMALAGENGAGKSTLMKILSGQYRPDAGRVWIRGEPLITGSTVSSSRLGVAIVPQELASIPDLTVYENLFVGHEIRGRFGTLDRKAMAREARMLLSRFGLQVDPAASMGRLAVGIRQIIEIIKATSHGARILLLDEPTSAISRTEVARLVTIVRDLAATGVSILFTTHKMEEIRAMADEVTILRDGHLIRTAAIDDITDDAIITAMIGRELGALFPDLPPRQDRIALAVKGLRLTPEAEPIDFEVHRGEILGLTGLVGAGRTELLETIYGLRTPAAGSITIDGHPLGGGGPHEAMAHRMAIVPEDRKGAGAVLSMSVLDNGTLPRLSMFSHLGILRNRSRRADIGKVMKSVRLKSDGLNQRLENLSGGNQQKVVLGRWLTDDISVLLLDEPTRGVDIGARGDIYQIIVDIAREGTAIIMASSDMPEILSLCHRALVMRAGGVAAELVHADLGKADVQDTIFRLASNQ